MDFEGFGGGVWMVVTGVVLGLWRKGVWIFLVMCPCDDGGWLSKRLSVARLGLARVGGR